MTEKKTGYDFYHDVLKSPRYVAAPMVDMSELPFRILCRRYGAELCYSPMLHSQQFLQDPLYRNDIFSTIPDDRPLIVQFCANDPYTFVKAAGMVASHCDAVDLNLGCPQSIAKKGHYGAFLQNEWDVIRSMVHKACSELPVPVTCKMRILPGPSIYSIEYAKMLEDSGCSVLTVHGRTREQKGHSTGLASWDVIKDIKENVKIPVIANGNILSFDDIKVCLEYTGADGIMSAEALLHNPALFSGTNPSVWDMAEEYLSLAEKYGTHPRHVRSHLFRILYLCLRYDEQLRKQLAKSSTFEDFRKICNSLKSLPLELRNECNTLEGEDHNVLNKVFKNLNVDNFSRTKKMSEKYLIPSLGDSCLYLDEELSDKNCFIDNARHDVGDYSELCPSNDCDINIDKRDMCTNIDFKNDSTDNIIVENSDICEKAAYVKCDATIDTEHELSSSIFALYGREVNLRNDIVDIAKLNEVGKEDNKSLNVHNELFVNLRNQSVKYLPIWLCHSRPRVIVDSEGKGCFRRSFETSDKNARNQDDDGGDINLSKKKLRKARHHARVLASMKEKRKTKKIRQKQLLELRKLEFKEIPGVIEKNVKKESKTTVRERMSEARGTAPKICIDLSYTSEMTNKELHRLASQLRRLYGSNRHTKKPLHIYFCNISPTDPLYKICCTKNDGFHSYVVEMVEKGPKEIFQSDDLVYLSPDSENVLGVLDSNKVYIIGGLVDETGHKGMSLAKAHQQQVETARLPIPERLERCGGSASGTVLAVNQVFDILLKYYETGDWIQALCSGVPERKGFRRPSGKLPSFDVKTIPLTTSLENVDCKMTHSSSSAAS